MLMQVFDTLREDIRSINLPPLSLSQADHLFCSKMIYVT